MLSGGTGSCRPCAAGLPCRSAHPATATQVALRNALRLAAPASLSALLYTLQTGVPEGTPVVPPQVRTPPGRLRRLGPGNALPWSRTAQRLALGMDQLACQPASTSGLQFEKFLPYAWPAPPQCLALRTS